MIVHIDPKISRIDGFLWCVECCLGYLIDSMSERQGLSTINWFSINCQLVQLIELPIN